MPKTTMNGKTIYRTWFAGVVLAGAFLLLQNPGTSKAQDQYPNQGQNQNQVQEQNSDQGQYQNQGPDQGQAGQGQPDLSQAGENQPAQDPPSVVGRMNFTQGSVSFQPGGEGDWVDAVPNRPLTTGDNLWADQNSRAELHIGSTAVRLAPETSLTFLDLDDQTTQLRLSQGTVIIRL